MDLDAGEQDDGFALRAATWDDFAFALRLYLDTMEPLLSALGAWDEAHYCDRLKGSYTPESSRIIARGGQDIGWIQVLERPQELNLAQFHILDGHRGTGIGTRLMEQLLERAALENKAVSLSSPRNNPVINFYKRLGFQVHKDDGCDIIDLLWK
jgi:ribosomal protein S18 acetylase RimI-like enzyme